MRHSLLRTLVATLNIVSLSACTLGDGDDAVEYSYYLTPSATTLELGEEETFAYSRTGDDESSDDLNEDAEWEIDGDCVELVDGSPGRVRAIAVGTCTIRASLDDGDEEDQDSVKTSEIEVRAEEDAGVLDAATTDGSTMDASRDGATTDSATTDSTTTDSTMTDAARDGGVDAAVTYGPAKAVSIAWNDTVTLLADETAGVRVAGRWNTALGATSSEGDHGSKMNLLDTTGSATSVSATWSGADIGDTTILSGAGVGDGHMMNYGLGASQTSSTNATVTFTGLSTAYPDGYKVVVYVGRGGGNPELYPNFSLTVGSTTITGNAMRSFYGRYDDFLGSGDQGNYYLSSTLTSATITITLTATDTGGTAGINGITFSPICPTGYSDCNNSEVDGCEVNTDADRDHCGGCFGYACGETELCEDGECACAGATTECLSQCVAYDSDFYNCGGCMTPCSSGQLCLGGVCTTAVSCLPGDSVCGMNCVTLGNDNNNCGECGNRCEGDTRCIAGACEETGGPIGCADGARDAFTSLTSFPNIAACGGGFTLPGLFPAPFRSGVEACETTGDDDTTNAAGTGCSAADLCAPGWHICRGGEIKVNTSNMGCSADSVFTMTSRNSFYAAAVSGSGCYECALEANAFVSGCTPSSCTANCQEATNLNNDIFGCGSRGYSLDSGKTARCDGLNKSGNNDCGSLTEGDWSCGGMTMESVTVTRTPHSGTEGGVLCCR